MLTVWSPRIVSSVESVGAMDTQRVVILWAPGTTWICSDDTLQRIFSGEPTTEVSRSQDTAPTWDSAVGKCLRLYGGAKGGGGGYFAMSVFI